MKIFFWMLAIAIEDVSITLCHETHQLHIVYLKGVICHVSTFIVNCQLSIVNCQLSISIFSMQTFCTVIPMLS